MTKVGLADPNLTPERDVSDGALVDARSYSSAMLNILDDFASERIRRDAIGRAVLNILEDFVEEKAGLSSIESAILNILEDFDVEKKKADRVNIELRNEIAERARAEEALRRAKAATESANRELEAFSYSVAHDLRAPLRSIDGFSQALVEDCAESLPEDGKTYLGYVRESAQQMARLIDDLLSLSRVSRVEIRRSPLDLVAIARTVVARLRRDQPDRPVEFLAPRELMVVGDTGLLTAVLENLIANAWKFTGKCSHPRVELGARLDEARTVYFVRDNGAGFNMAYAGKLFAVFQRLHTANEFEGTGIGLAIVERIVRRHGGQIWGEGEVDHGATFHFTLEETA
jgi:light-regulated signal transduction histidine kinase (bacteriophytochrome)